MTPTLPILAKPLDNLHEGEKALVLSISHTNTKLSGKLLAMGIIAGTTIQVLRFAPFGDPVQIRALGYELALRRSEASQIQVVPLK